MVPTYDVGSIPFPGDFERFTRGLRAHPLLGLLHLTGHASERGYFEDKIVESFLDKVRAGISIPNYPQFRDMNEMFLSCLDGIAKTEAGYRVVGRISVPEGKLTIPEVAVIEEKAREIYERIGDFFNVKVCVTGPYTLASLFVGRESNLFVELGRVISKFVESNIFSGRFGRVALVAVDEPVFGLIDDPLLDHGRGGREELLKAWETVFHQIRSRNAQSIIHLHNTANDLFWQVRSLDIVESHVNDPLYSSSKTKECLERSDKFLKASVCVTDFDALIRNMETSRGTADEAEIGQRIADAWTEIRKGRMDPAIFLESTDVISDRLRRIVRQHGVRVSYAGPECGLRSFPTYDSAMECLRRVAEATQNPNL